MTVLLVTAPLVEPVSLADAKAHMRIEHQDEDDLISAMLIAARTHIEAMTGCLMIEQVWRVFASHWSDQDTVNIALYPLINIESIKIYSTQTDFEEVGSSLYDADLVSRPGTIKRLNAALNPAKSRNGIQIDVRVGYGTTSVDVPRPLRQAILMLCSHWYEQRGLGFDPKISGEPTELKKLLSHYKGVRLA